MAGWEHDEDRAGVHADVRAGRSDSGHARGAGPAHLAPSGSSFPRAVRGDRRAAAPRLRHSLPPGDLSLRGWRDAHLGSFPYTPPVAEIYALHACLEQYLAEGADAVLARHRAAAHATRAGARAMGLRLWAADEAICPDTVTALRMPDGVAEADVRAIARSESGVMLSGGQAGLPVVQIGHMGPAAYPLGPVIGLVALGRALRRAGAAADVGAAVEAALGHDLLYPPA
jgi:aspartate aminotransferase-like enzyme